MITSLGEVVGEVDWLGIESRCPRW